MSEKKEVCNPYLSFYTRLFSFLFLLLLIYLQIICGYSILFVSADHKLTASSRPFQTLTSWVGRRWLL